MKKLNIYFCYFVHCLGGNNKQFVNIAEKTEELFTNLFNCNEENETKNIISWYCNEANSGFRSSSALEIMYDNAFKEFIEYFEEKFVKNLKNDEEKYNKFEGVECNVYLSFIGHSIGGNVSRGLISKLYSPFTNNSQTFENYFDFIIKKYPFISNILPCSYIAISSPHLGSLVTSTKEPNSKFSKNAEKFVVKNFTNIVVGDVGKNLTFKDEKLKKTIPIKETSEEQLSKYALINNCSKKAMADLGRFPNRTLTAHLRNDVQVKYCSAMGCIETPYPHLYKHEKERLVNDKINDVRIVMYSGFGEGSELDFYKKEIFNEKVSPKFYYDNTTKYIPDIDIDEQIKNALIMKNIQQNNKEFLNIPNNYEELEDVFVTDNDGQQDIPVALIKKFNQISFRRVSFDLLVPFHWKLYTHGLDLGFPPDSFIKPNAYMRCIIKKIVPFYANLLIADFIKTSEQSNTYSLNNLIKN